MSYSVAVVGSSGMERKTGVLKVASVILVDLTSMSSDKATQNISPLPSYFSAPTPQLVRLNREGVISRVARAPSVFYIDLVLILEIKRRLHAYSFPIWTSALLCLVGPSLIAKLHGNASQLPLTKKGTWRDQLGNTYI